MRRSLKRIVLALLLVVVLLLAPVGYVELFCSADGNGESYEPKIADLEFRRAEANSYMTYPEWHIVYAYQGLAETLRTGDEHRFGYASSIAGFWQAACALNRVAGSHGGGDFDTRATMHTIGVSFTFEMAMKALYEEMLGRLSAALRGSEKSPQDVDAAEMAADYGRFLEQTPWYKYDFDAAVARLWAEPLTMPVRGWERRLALGGEWKAKAAYARAIATAVDAATGGAQLRIRSIVTGMLPSELAAMEDVEIIDVTPDHVEIETPRYRAFTRIVARIAEAGGNMEEIAGNDDIMLTALSDRDAVALADGERLITTVGRDGFGGYRHLIDVKVVDLADTIRTLAARSARLEHVYDY
ncbi:MAG: hypothetical protein KDJ80_14035 [Nitratireductor sp.]|nr:hypothetical protein [Nitratireductor sp.]